MSTLLFSNRCQRALFKRGKNAAFIHIGFRHRTHLESTSRALPCGSVCQLSKRMFIFFDERRVHSRPIQLELAMGNCAIPQVQINETLVWNSSTLGYRFELVDGLFIKPNSDLLFEQRSAWIFLRSGKVIFFAHRTPFTDKTGMSRESIDDPDTTWRIEVAA